MNYHIFLRVFLLCSFMGFVGLLALIGTPVDTLERVAAIIAGPVMLYVGVKGKGT